MSRTPTRDGRGEKSYQDRMKNYQEEQRKLQVASNAQRTKEAGLKPGPSGMPMQHHIYTPSRARAEEIAKSQGKR